QHVRKNKRDRAGLSGFFCPEMSLGCVRLVGSEMCVMYKGQRHIHIIYVTIITKLLPLSRLNVFVWLSLGLLVGF
ncbi:hypothetical protein, partial [Serratia marcescens]|uniref:hypothetical protein n=1 Tax=Serratia marcescens TaxID=615 RepID=UPI001BAE97CA